MGFGPGGLDCDEALREAFRYLDDETDAAERAKIRQHLEECAPCFRKFGFDADLKSLIARRCGGDRAPEALRVRIRTELTHITVDYSHHEYRPQ